MVLFVYAAFSKLLDFETFKLQLAQSPLLSAYAGLIAWLVPSLEIIIAILLLSERFRVLAFYAFFTLMVMFTTYIFIILNFSDFVPCSCGGVLEKLSWNQHLIFNVVFMMLAGVAVFITAQWNNKKIWLLLATLAIIGIGIVVLLFAFSEKKMHRNNAFQRRYLPHPIEKMSEFTLDYDTFYLAGYSDSIVYLGNYRAPLYITTNNIVTNEQKVIQVELNNKTLPFRKVRIEVKPPQFTVADGTVPVLFQGNITEKVARQIPFDSVYFTQFVVIDSNSTGIATVDSKFKKKTIGVSKILSGKDRSILTTATLRTDVPEPFADDGVLAWNENLNYFLYTYYYKNNFEVIDKNLQPIYTGSTIDTIKNPLLDVAYSKQNDVYTLGGKSIVVNRLSATSANYLFINSDRLGRFEDEGPLRSASIIDVYDIIDKSYVFSFYLYHQPEGKLYDFQVYNNILIALVEDKLFIYKLKPEYFISGSNATHTGQYQD
ncbi:hypothetical protein A7A78_14155 [Aequorivita soesokkakensis]|uniref:Methylamine utilisation protein MauE domain-containing protein n=1 Tax=Aequorivita soesokkakensis TaxID=1385699 RepID=A0A1A9LBM8_9FLAO|nr:hypothetical protein A7A78_14155 [Aequorivita soesokkakensis]